MKTKTIERKFNDSSSDVEQVGSNTIETDTYVNFDQVETVTTTKADGVTTP